MGNCKSCFYAEPPTAKLIEVDGNIRQIKLPITAAEIMLDDPGHVLSPAQQIRLTSRISAMKADEGLSAGKVYLLVPACRIHCKASESEMALVDSFTGEKRRRRRRSSKVLPAVPVTDGTGEKVESPIPVLQGNGTGLAGHRMGSPKQWRPVLDPIHEGI